MLSNHRVRRSGGEEDEKRKKESMVTKITPTKTDVCSCDSFCAYVCLCVWCMSVCLVDMLSEYVDLLTTILTITECMAELPQPREQTKQHMIDSTCILT